MVVSDLIPEIIVSLPAPMNPAQACYGCHAFVSIRCYVEMLSTYDIMSCLLGYHHPVVTQPDWPAYPRQDIPANLPNEVVLMLEDSPPPVLSHTQVRHCEI